MFEHHFGLRENPFPAGHQLKFVYPSREHQEARAHLRYGIENNEPFLLITGEVGTGKTTSLYDALHEWGDQVAVALITNSALTRQEMLEEICLRFGIELPPGVSKPAALVMLEKHLVSVRSRGEKAVLMMDEAQNLSMDLLEEIRLLSNLEHKGDKLLQIFLVGQPELEAHLARHELRQLRQRITVHYRLNPLSPDETMGYIHHHINVAGGNGPLVFAADTCREIYRLSHGIPREINTLASSALIAAYADGSPSVRLEHIATVAHEGDFRSVLSNTRPEPVPAPPARSMVPPPASTHAAPPTAPPTAPPQLQRPRPLPAQPPDFTWPPLPQLSPSPGQVPTPARAAAPPPQPPAPPAPPPRPESPQGGRERGEITRGLMAAMRRAEAPEPSPAAAPTPPPPARPPFALRPAPQPAPPAPIPLPTRGPAAAPANQMPPHLGALGPMGTPVVPPARTAQPDLSGLPPRLRERLEREFGQKAPASSSTSVRNWMIGVGVVAALGIALILMQRFGAIDWPILRGAAGGRTTSSTGIGGPLKATGSGDQTAALIDSLKREVNAAKHATPVKPAATNNEVSQPSHPKEAAPGETGTSETPVPPPASVQKSTNAEKAQVADAGDVDTGTFFGIGVASYLDIDRAREEKDKFVQSTSLPGVVVPYLDEGSTMYRIVLGKWATAGDAERASTALMDRGLISEAHVVTLPKK
jgi:type II secretory pathway predicted ATPase ExeA